MTKEQINIAIAEICGWTNCEHVKCINLTKGFPPKDKPPTYGTYENGMAQLPNYYGDLNACHEMENLIRGSDFYSDLYKRHLFNVCGRDAESFGFHHHLSYLWHATAAQRAEAFLRALGKWEES